ncbi:hypothetical protein [Anaplasma phagocytophilum]|uniref:hypothetical protein n=1 Tax=Anaplasma phagocytophilum TaxID=948 RepID=UPI00201AC70A
MGVSFGKWRLLLSSSRAKCCFAVVYLVLLLVSDLGIVELMVSSISYCTFASNLLIREVFCDDVRCYYSGRSHVNC